MSGDELTSLGRPVQEHSLSLTASSQKSGILIKNCCIPKNKNIFQKNWKPCIKCIVPWDSILRKRSGKVFKMDEAGY